MPLHHLKTLRDRLKTSRAGAGETPVTFADSNPVFEIVALGVRSGVADGNLSSYLIRPLGTNEAVICDAGTLGNGLKRAEARGVLNDIPIMPDSALGRAGHVLKQTVRAYLISHTHLDHVAGLVLSSPEDTAKPIYALPQTNAILSDHLFNGRVWGAMGDRGPEPHIGKYTYKDMHPGKSQTIEGSGLTITAWPLSHASTTSTAFLIQHHGRAILYMGDTQADQPDGPQNLHELWEAIAPLVRDKKLHTIIMGVTYPDEQPDNALCGQLRPKDLLQSLRDLGHVCGGRHHIRGLRVLVGHVKETFHEGGNPVRHLYRELQDGNDIGIHFMMAEQSARYLV
ncbi:3',5'-cyclic-nucleotide phosphodiesterase [Parasaccharibacter sp. TMW 2.1888]|uniref:MBL fold metallo-hydrolase n=1 Tax=Parasaccharibacter sp. TMW 2.1888 TaxID=2268025 RepID=UPI00205C972C|nr:3',5'-cyclic-nucleotide phosphodiesterase [Parasaccharibacter sp. TMW 2.1888]UPO79499.1 3',5'-cyclic-nucleotide phosphodiesterase [Parasaccharibacter sp. TMW 2.1888]